MIQYAAVINMNKQKIKSILLLLTATVIWGCAFIAQSVGNTIGPFTFQAVRCLLAVTFLVGVCFVLDRTAGRSFTGGWRNKKLWKTGLSCGLALFVAASLQQVGLVYTDAGKAGFITAMYIVLVPVCGLFFRQKPPLSALIAIAVAVVGLYLLSCVGVTAINRGDLMMTGCALAFAVQITIVDRFAADLDGVRLNCIQALICGLLSIPFVIAESPALPDIMEQWLPLVFAGVLSMGVAYTLQIIGQKHLEPTPASLIMSLESVFAAIGAWLILHEQMTLPELTGSILVFSAVLISQIPAKKQHR